MEARREGGGVPRFQVECLPCGWSGQEDHLSHSSSSFLPLLYSLPLFILHSLPTPSLPSFTLFPLSLFILYSLITSYFFSSPSSSLSCCHISSFSLTHRLSSCSFSLLLPFPINFSPFSSIPLPFFKVSSIRVTDESTESVLASSQPSEPTLP